ncbi:SDR family oxidoreductase [Roseibium sp.]|uniref:SDR family oxidoreductase n=1 Tax=Roseibium sp. TaxID=1936156 RepID=UPI003D0D5C3A
MQDSGLIVVTGGAIGLGRELTKHYHGLGRKLVICGRTESALDEVTTLYPGVVTVAADLADPAGRKHLVDAVHEQEQPVAMLIHNAALQHQHDFVSRCTPIEKVETEISVNFLAPIELTIDLLPLLRQAEQARVVFVTSALARVPKKSAPVYCATKAGLSNFARALRYQLEGTGVAVSEVVPDLMVTRMTAGRGGKGFSAAEAANKIVAGLGAGKEEIRLGRVPKLFALHRLLPDLAYRVLKTS